MNALANAPAALLSCSDLDVRVADRMLVRQLTLAIQRGTMTCVLGRNGAGKTLTLHTLCGLRAPAAGSLLFDGRPLDDWPRRPLARQLGLLSQTSEDPFPSSVLDTTLIGRHPHIGFWQWESESDRAIARAALQSVDMDTLETREIDTLSGGERRRVAIATLLAQDPELMLLDEPINHLDPQHQIDVLRLLRARADAGRAVVMSLHDIGLATRFGDQALLLFGNGEWLHGPVQRVLNEATISRLYGVTVRELTWEGGRTFVTV
ncbi:MAG TPA: ABC transporter ATP-binding protein [Povalibacter sp.]|uniref:ABC transporter ATP-binding protein n=1 Tax=Povalibacter sp. TaxID=1962978 RepID=UPI002BDE9347|nr:ABC transporter ATP-binding protein [Povalibacter sp.]HMN45028.1 ABC transporter ATP-binding protein [Povalibacter sp.]